MSMNRRQFVRALGAGAALGAAGTLAGCATTGGGGKRVVVIGGGFGGATAAKYIRMWAPDIAVTLVERGQKIAELGDSDADQAKLHFEIRLQSKPVDPLKYLPGRKP